MNHDKTNIYINVSADLSNLTSTIIEKATVLDLALPSKIVLVLF